MGPWSSQSIGTRILLLVIGIVSLAFVTVACIGGLAFNNLTDGFLSIVNDQNQQFAQMLNRNSERATNRFVDIFEENARTKGETLIARDSLNLKNPFLDNSFTQVREALQNSFNFDSSMLLASFVVMEGDQIKAWQYLDRDHKEGLGLPIVYDSAQQSWIASFQGQRVTVPDPGMENLRTLERATIRKIEFIIGSGVNQHKVAAYEAIMPISEGPTDHIDQRLKDGETIAYLRYLISLELMDQAISSEESAMQETKEEQRKITEHTLDKTQHDITHRIRSLALVLVLTAIGVLCLAFMISLWLSRRIAQPIKELSLAADKIALGHYNQRIDINATDEIGRLGKSFETMRVQVKTFTENLQVLVDEKTVRLHDALQTVTSQSQKIREIMQRIDQGILTIGPQQEIEEEYSQHLRNLYPISGPSMAGRSVIDLIFRDSIASNEEINMCAQSLACCLGGDPLNWDMNAESFPRQIKYVDDCGEKTFELSWNPIIESGIIQRFLLTIRDKTKELILEEQLKDAAQASSRFIQSLTELVSAPSDALAAMLRDSHAALKEIEQSQDSPSLEHKRNYIRLHTMKGAARSLSLKQLALAIHDAEVFLQQLVSHGEYDGQGFAAAVSRIRDELDFNRDIAFRVLKIKIDDFGDESQTLFEMLSNEVRVVRHLCQQHHVKLGGLVIEDRVLDWNPRLLIDAVEATRHALTNSLDHGYFKPIEEGKMPADQQVFLKVSAFCDNGEINLVFQDEGLGFDKVAIRQLAKRQGISWASDDELINIMLLEGLTTAKEVTHLSGRGAGLSAIQTFAREWYGRLQLLENQPRGTKIIVSVPETKAFTSDFSDARKDPTSA